MSNRRSISYRPDIDGLRALAVLLVLIFHFQLSPVGEGGFLGVDVFFVISGFLITAIILKQLDGARFSLYRFYSKRILRLAPVLLIVLLLVMIAGAFIYLPEDFAELARQSLATQLYYSNIYFWQNVDYFGLHTSSAPLLHTWSLAVEEQFYLIFPLFLMVIHRFVKPFFWHLIALGAVFSFVLNIALVDHKPEATFYLVPSRGWEFLLGSLCVLAVQHLRNISRSLCEAISFLGAATILAGVLLYDKEISFPGYYALIPSVGAMLVILGGSHHHTLVSRVLAGGAAVYIGRLSYSLYLVHWPIHVFALYLLGDAYSLSWRVGMLALTFVASMFLFHCVEVPVRGGRFFKSGAQVYRYYFSAVALSVVISLVILQSSGLPSRFPDSVVDMAAFAQDEPPLMDECQFKDKEVYTAADFCVIGDPEVQPNWLIYGDSHAWAAKEAFAKWLDAKSASGLFMFRHSCPPLVGVDVFGSFGECARFNENVLAFAESAPQLTEVILISAWVYGKTGKLTTHADIMLNRVESSDLFNDSFSDTLDRFNELNRRVYVWGPVPGAKANVPRSLARARDISKASDEISYTLEEHLDNHSYFYDVLKKKPSNFHQLFSPAEALCLDTGKCQVVIDGKPVYFDSTHLAQSLSGWWAEQLEKQESEPSRILQQLE